MKRFSLRGRPVTTALLLLGLFAAVVVLLYQKSAVLTALKPGDTVIAEFSRQYKLQEDRSVVKLAGTPVGVVSGIQQTDHSTVAVSLKLDPGTLAKLGSAPSAEIRPTTVLGGIYYVALTPGGSPAPFTAGTIPVQRTRTPVELDTLLPAISKPAQSAVQKALGQLDGTMKAGAGQSLQGLLDVAPGTLQPAGTVLDAARGVNPDTDLSRLVTDFNRTAGILTKQDGQLGSIVDSLSSVSNVLANERQPLADAVATLPDTLKLTRTGAQALSGTLDRLAATAASDRPAIQQLDPLLQHLDPALVQLRPVLADLRPLLDQAQPLVQQLVPTAQQGTKVLGDVRGPVLDRLNGPIITTIMSPWHGQAPKYPNGGNGNKFYQELGYLGAHWNNAAKFYDSNGGLVRVQVGLSASSVLNAPGGLDQLLNTLSQLFGPPQQPGTPSAPAPSAPGPTAPGPSAPAPSTPVAPPLALPPLPGPLGGTH